MENPASVFTEPVYAFAVPLPDVFPDTEVPAFQFQPTYVAVHQLVIIVDSS